MSTSLGKMSEKARKFEKAWTRYDRRAKFAREGRICKFCGMICGDAKQTIAHEQSVFHVEDRVEAARIRKNAEVTAPAPEVAA
jgi:hypothetical protein